MRLLGLRGSVVLVRILLSFRVEGFGFGVLCVSYLAIGSCLLFNIRLPLNTSTGPLLIHLL
jgi:hypothetical protein